MKHITNNEYAQMVKKASPPSNSAVSIPMAFLFGGAICTLGEALINLYIHWGVEKDVAYACGSITLVFLSALLTGLNVYDDLGKIGGAGTLVPITGFANAVASPALEFKTEGYIMGIGAKLFAISGPVIVYGISAGVIYGLILYLFQLY
ncbi:SpoVA/SpoVAEb family sporulation membrane protein [Ruminococcaceae bacterium OttesenSCG-928-L11]|nr:SpoVA/SpoVAEb family sporulation membrane protein [Ruminococcaceae bacterium OttesenSCG-928-L11]